MGVGLYRIRPWPGHARRTWDPWRDLNEFRQAMEQVAAQAPPPVSVSETASFTPEIDLYDSGVVLVVRIDLPGIRPADLTVTIEDGTLKVEGLRDTQGGSRDAYLRCERRVGRFVRALPLPAGVEAGLARGTLSDGVLEIILPKGETGSSDPSAVNVEITNRRAEPLVDAVAL